MNTNFKLRDMKTFVQVLMLVCLFVLTLGMLSDPKTDLFLLGMGYVLSSGILLVSILEKK